MRGLALVATLNRIQVLGRWSGMNRLPGAIRKPCSSICCAIGFVSMPAVRPTGTCPSTASANGFRPSRSSWRSTGVARAGQPVAQAVQVSPIVPFRKHAIHDAFAELRAGESDQHLQIGEPARQFGRAGDEADTQVRRERLGEPAEVDHPLQLVERGQPDRRLRGRARMQVAVDVVLDDHEVVLGGHPQDAERGRRRHARCWSGCAAPTR